MKAGVVLLGLALMGLAFSGCSYENVTTYDYIRDMGFEPNNEYQLLGSEKYRDQIGEFSGNIGGGFFFLSGSVSGESRPASTLGFAIDVGEGRVVVVEFPFEKIEFIVKESAHIPSVRFHITNWILWKKASNDNRDIKTRTRSKWDSKKIRNNAIDKFSNKSLSQVLRENTQSVTITLSKETFEQEIMPLQFSR